MRSRRSTRPGARVFHLPQMLLHLQARVDDVLFRFEPLAVKITAGLHGGVGLTSQGEMVVEAISAPQQQ